MSSGDFKHFGNIVHNRRIERGLSQVQLAELAQVSQSVVSRTESGARLPDIAEAAAIAKALDTGLDELLSLSTGKMVGDEGLRLLTVTFRKLSPKDQTLVVDFARLLISRQR